jgi:hypothetical protein
MKRSIRFAFLVLGANLISGFAWAHHSTAMYDFSKSVTLDAVVRSFQWNNPHNYIQVVAANDKGEPVEWAVEAGTPATASNMGWSKDTLKPGDHLKLVIAPARDGSHGGTLKTATLADGTTLNSVGGKTNASSPFDSIPSVERVPTK